VAVVLQFLFSVYATYNLLVLFTQVATGITTYCLLYDLTEAKIASLCASFAMVFSTYMLTQHAYGQVIDATQYCVPLCLLAARSYKRNRTLKKAVLLALSLGGVFLSGPYMLFSFGFIFFLGVLIYNAVFSDRKLLQWKVTITEGLLFFACMVAVFLFYFPLIRNLGQWEGGGGHYYSSLASFVAIPFWHRSPWFRSLRVNGIAPEMAFGYIGIASTFLIGYGLFKGFLRKEADFRFWFWILCWVAVLSLGPWLRLTPQHRLPIPLPYLLIEMIPGISVFRSVVRIWSIGTLAAAILAAFSLRAIMKDESIVLRASLGILFIGFIVWEFDVLQINQWYVSSIPSSSYVVVKNDPAPFAILDLPQFYFPEETGFATAGSYYMLFQPFHQKPMVFGYPSRMRKESLTFSSSTPFVYELLHPWVLSKLERPENNATREYCMREGRKILERAHIKYVLFHGSSRMSESDFGIRLKKWLDKSLGPPLLVDSENITLYRTYDSDAEDNPGN